MAPWDGTLCKSLNESGLGVNVFLDAIPHRRDWENLVARYDHNGFRSLRA